jgi:hypothetical protein
MGTVLDLRPALREKRISDARVRLERWSDYVVSKAMDSLDRNPVSDAGRGVGNVVNLPTRRNFPGRTA